MYDTRTLTGPDESASVLFTANGTRSARLFPLLPLRLPNPDYRRRRQRELTQNIRGYRTFRDDRGI
jgi:hypothetical protein